MSQLTGRVRLLTALVIAVQLFDFAIHAATNQLEPLRVTANLIVLVLLGLAIAGQVALTWQIGGAAMTGYLLLNILFLILNGMLNNGAPRTLLFLLVALTVGLTGLLTVLAARPLPRA